MGDERSNGHGEAQANLLVKRLVKVTGITDEARALIRDIGPDWNSLVREARYLKGRQ